MKLSRNFLGSHVSETDAAMLQHAFVNTPEYETLSQDSPSNRHIVVGRRGTGKSALFLKLVEKWNSDKKLELITLVPDESTLVSIRDSCAKVTTDYKRMRQYSRLLWHHALLSETALRIAYHYKFGKTDRSKIIQIAGSEWKSFGGATPADRLAKRLATLFSTPAASALENFVEVQQKSNVNELSIAIVNEIERMGHPVTIIIDRLDEGWDDSTESVGFIAGLLAALASISENTTCFRTIVFLRDNIFRAIEQRDPDSARLLEGVNLRLHWNVESLFRLICNRIRIKADVAEEKLVKVWNLIADHGIEGQAGFIECLGHTLYRPRDIIHLLNEAAYEATRHDRGKIIIDDITSSAKAISFARYKDLLREYEGIYPAIRNLSAVFQSQMGVLRFDEYSALLMSADTLSANALEKQDMLFVPDLKSRIQRLYLVGFIGVYDKERERYVFCHDGSPTKLSFDAEAPTIMVHPCYWEALGCVNADRVDWNIAVQLIHDEYDVKNSNEPQDRIKVLAELLAQGDKLAPGKEQAGEFEEWSLSTLKILFAGQVSNLVLHPNANGHQRRDIVGSITAETGFWARVNIKYNVRQIMFEVKNYYPLTEDDFRQARRYLNGQFGSLAYFIVNSNNENEGRNDLQWISLGWDENKSRILLIPKIKLLRLLRKQRSPQRFLYTENQLSTQLDFFENRDD